MRKNYMKPGASCYSFAINENIASSGDYITFVGAPNGAKFSAEYVDGVYKAYVEVNGSKVYGTTYEELAMNVLTALGPNANYDEYMDIMLGHGAKGVWLG